MSAPSPSMYSKQAAAAADRMGLVMGKANLEVFAATLQMLAEKDPDILAVTSDSRGSGKLGPFAKALPKQIVEVGIAEQNLVGVAAGLAAVGKRVFAVSPACFLTARSLEQIKNDVAYSDHPACMIGISAGVSYGALGSTHHSLHDFAVLRAINNIDIIAPADNTEAEAAVRFATLAPHPVYLRFGKAPLYTLPQANLPIERGKARLLRDGKDVALIATGECVINAVLAAEFLAAEGISCRVLSLPFVRPLDEDAVLAAARECKAVLTVEEHMVHGGLGEACAGLLMQAGASCRFRMLGIPDAYTVTGSQADIFRHYRLHAEGIQQAAVSILSPQSAPQTPSNVSLPRD